jgi:hypothetical protein
MGYFNTTKLFGSKISEAVKNASTQDDKIFLFFFENKNKEFSPCQIHKIVFAKSNVPLTSIRRSMTNLTNAGKLIKTSKKVIGVFGKDNYTWKLKG